MREFLILLFTFILEIATVVIVAKYLIRYAAKVFADEFEKRMKK